MSKLKVSEEAAAAIVDVRDPTTDACDWLLLWYGDTKNELKVFKSGQGGMDSLAAELPQDQVMYGLVMVKGGNEKDKLAVRFAGVSWCGPSTPPMKRSKVLNHKDGVATALGHCHVTFQPKELAEISQEILLKTIKLTAGTNYHAGLRNMKKDAEGNYQTTDGEHVKASDAKAKYNANAEAAKMTRTLSGDLVASSPANSTTRQAPATATAPAPAPATVGQ